MKTTNVLAKELNYDHYEEGEYDRDIKAQIWGYEKMHEKVLEVLKSSFNSRDKLSFLELGIGTGNTTLNVIKEFPNFASYLGVDFSHSMLEGARNKLSKNIQLVLKDFSDMEFPENQDVVFTVIGFHHQTSEGKKLVIKKAYECLNEGGLLIIADLTKWQNPELEAKYAEMQDNYTSEHARDEKSD